MCGTLVEHKFINCNHIDTWEIPSPDPNCNGILHRMRYDSTKVCKHCWIAQGFRKRDWKRATVEPGFGTDWFQHRNVNQILYPIQGVGITPTAPNCPTWRKRHYWHTRMWAARQLNLQRIARVIELEMWNDIGRPPIVPNVSNIDIDDKDGGELLEVVPIEVLAPDDRVCALCRCPYVGSTGEPEDLCSGGGEVARRLPCGHIYGIACIITGWKHSLDTLGEARCPFPLCRVPFLVQLWPPRTFKTRLEEMAVEYYAKYYDRQRPISANYPELDPEAITFPEYALIWGSIVAALPMFATVNHGLNIWGSKHGKLPYDQMAVVVVVGAALQIAWMLAVLFSPLLFISYLTYRYWYLYRTSLVARFWASFTGVMNAIRGI